nr:MAG TPA: hypothetical protein [Caudoviricetes sp.]DAP86529.1 MAG TPA: hypothetical protein [Caudoviricetes sp.]
MGYFSFIECNHSFGKFFTYQDAFYLPASLYTHLREAGIYDGIYCFS